MCDVDDRPSSVNGGLPKKPHVHAALIKQWADGAEIEMKYLHNGEYVWVPVRYPGWSPASVYRVKPPIPHRWQKEIDAFNAGREIEFRMYDSLAWVTVANPLWLSDGEYRIKPEPVVLYLSVGRTVQGSVHVGDATYNRSVIERLGRPLKCWSANKILRLELDPDTLDVISAKTEKPNSANKLKPWVNEQQGEAS